MNADHTERALDRTAPRHHRVDGARSMRFGALARALLAVVAGASLIACSGSDEDEPTPSSAWDEMNWDEGVWE